MGKSLPLSSLMLHEGEIRRSDADCSDITCSGTSAIVAIKDKVYMERQSNNRWTNDVLPKTLLATAVGPGRVQSAGFELIIVSGFEVDVIARSRSGCQVRSRFPARPTLSEILSVSADRFRRSGGAVRRGNSCDMSSSSILMRL